MDHERNRAFGEIITRLINGQSLDEEEAYLAFCRLLRNEVSKVQQGGFLAALTAKGETAEEIAGGWRAVYELDTCKVAVEGGENIVDNCGTGMDTFKSFNISTAASILAAAGGVKVARHGARAISSKCGTVDVAEQLGVDVDCPATMVAASVAESGLGVFNGMSPAVHPGALGRILAQIHFGSPLNIAASLAHPVMPKKAVRGVYSRAMMEPVLEVMKRIGYTDVILVHGALDDDHRSMDEASVCGTTFCLRYTQGRTESFAFVPEDVGLQRHPAESILALESPHAAARHLVRLFHGEENGGCRDAVLLNAALLFLLAGAAVSVGEGCRLAREIFESREAIAVLHRWVAAQNRNPAEGLARLASHLR